MTREEAEQALREIETLSSEELDKAVSNAKGIENSNQAIGAVLGSGIGALSGIMTADSPMKKVVGGIAGGLAGGVSGHLLGVLRGRHVRDREYSRIKGVRDRKISNILKNLNDEDSYALQRYLGKLRSGIQSNSVDYGIYTLGQGKYYGGDEIVTHKDEEGNPMLSLFFTGINSSVDDARLFDAHSPEAALFYNKNRNLFSDIQSNRIFDDPITADAYIDRITSKISEIRNKTGRNPRIRLSGYSAGGRGVVNFLAKMRERDPQFRADEIIGIDPYQYPWEKVPASLSDPSNPVARRIVYSRLANRISGSSKSGLAKLKDIISNLGTTIAGRRLNGLSASEIVENPIGGIAHTDPEVMYRSAVKILAQLRNKHKKEEQQ